METYKAKSSFVAPMAGFDEHEIEDSINHNTNTNISDNIVNNNQTNTVIQPVSPKVWVNLFTNILP